MKRASLSKVVPICFYVLISGQSALASAYYNVGAFLKSPAPAFVQQNQAVATNSASAAVTLSMNVAAGNMLVIGVIVPGSKIVSSVADNLGNTWAKAVSKVAGSGTVEVEIWYAMNVASGATTITATLSGTVVSNTSIIGAEFSGIVSASALDQTAGNNGASTTAASTGTTAALAQPVELAVAVLGWASTATSISAGPTGGYSLVASQTASAPPLSEDYLVTAGTAGQSTSWTLSSTNSFVSCIATFKGR